MDYQNPLPVGAYGNLILSDVRFAGNGASQEYAPPSNALEFIPAAAFQTPVSGTFHTHPLNNYDINFWSEVLTTTLSVSKLVTGDFANRSLDFEFTIAFTDSNGTPLPGGTLFSFTGGILENSGATAPPNGTLTLDNDGHASFHLKHGQAITITEVPLNVYVQIIETPDLNFETSFVDSENAGTTVPGNDTTRLPMTADRTFRFINEREVPPPMGLNLGSIGAALLLPVLILFALLAVYVIKKMHKRRKSPFWV